MDAHRPGPVSEFAGSAPDPGTSLGRRTPSPTSEPQFVVDSPTLGLPKGGGAVRGIDEQFRVNSCNGTASLTLPLPFTPGRDGNVPPIALRYDVGNGNGLGGLGWQLDVPSIRRRTDRHVATYDERDTFTLVGTDDLVPLLEPVGVGWQPAAVGGPYGGISYRPRIDRDHSRIEQFFDDADSWWRVTTRDNVTTIFGRDSQSRIADPVDDTQVAVWLPSFAYDDRGNCMVFEYAAEDLSDVPQDLAEASRHRAATAFANRHLKRVLYGNRVPYSPAPDPFGPVAPVDGFHFEMVLDYGEHDDVNPEPAGAPGRVWPARGDPWSSRRHGFEVRTYRLLRRALMFHRFDELGGGVPTLVRSLDLEHVEIDGLSHLSSVTQRGYARRPDGSYSVASMPPMIFEYEPTAWSDEVHEVDHTSLAGLPVGVGNGYRWMDLDGEGIDGIFTEQAGAWWYKRNRGRQPDGRVRFDSPRPVASAPSLGGFDQGVAELEDLDANGERQLVIRRVEPSGYFPRNEGGWRPFVPFPQSVRIDLDDRHLKMLDVVGDGRGHIVVSEQDAFVWYRSVGTSGHTFGGRVAVGDDEESGPALVFADDGQSIHLADMTGDGLVDIVRVRSGEVCYWPNLGYGRFGARIAMDQAPLLPDGHASRVKLADLTGTGPSDVVYLHAGGCTAYLNQSGNRLDAGHRLAAPYSGGDHIEVGIVDLLGTGTACVVWSSARAADADAPMRYVDPTAGRKPHLLRRWSTSMGKEVELTHSSSTWHYLEAEREGRPWRTRLPFPVHCVRRVQTRDLIRGTQLTTEYRYFDGSYDATEREFRGFGMVEQVDTSLIEHWARSTAGHLEDRSVHPPPSVSRTWFSVGDGRSETDRDQYWPAVLERSGLAGPVDEPNLPDTVIVVPDGTAVDRRDGLRACKGSARRVERFGLDAPVLDPTDEARRRELTPYEVQERCDEVRITQPATTRHPAVYTVHEQQSISWTYERTTDDRRAEHTLNVVVDELGNVELAAVTRSGRAIVDPSLSVAAAGMQSRAHVVVETTDFSQDVIDDRHHLRRVPARTSAFEIIGLPFAGELASINDFVRNGFHVVDDAAPTDDPVAPAAPGTILRRLLSAGEHTYWSADASAQLAVGSLEAPALPHETYELAFTPGNLGPAYDGRVDAAMLAAAGYVERTAGTWWVPSGHHEHRGAREPLADMLARFHVAVAHVDGLGTRTTITHHQPTAMLITQVEDAAGNVTRATRIDWRTLAPVQMVDPNGNVSENVLDELARIKATAMVGHGEGDSLDGHVSWTTPVEQAAVDVFLSAPSSIELAATGTALLGRASARYVYDPDGMNHLGGFGAPTVATISREEFASVSPDSVVQVAFEYSNGKGEVELRKAQAESGLANQTTVLPDGGVEITVIDTAALVPPRLRWLGNGRHVVDDHDRTVKEYEPFFSVTHRFENARELVDNGVASLWTRDPLGRPIRLDHPDGTFELTELGTWHTVELDRNDTASTSQWYRRRVDRTIDGELIASGKDPSREREAALSTDDHTTTPFVRHLDSCGRPVVELQHAGFDPAGDPVLVATEYHRDVEGRSRAVVDGRNVTTMRYQYDLRGNLTRYDSADSGTRRMFADVRGEPRHAWDDRGHELSVEYDDPLRRPTSKRVRGGDGPIPLDHVVERPRLRRSDGPGRSEPPHPDRARLRHGRSRDESRLRSRRQPHCFVPTILHRLSQRGRVVQPDRRVGCCARPRGTHVDCPLRRSRPRRGARRCGRQHLPTRLQRRQPARVCRRRTGRAARDVHRVDGVRRARASPTNRLRQRGRRRLRLRPTDVPPSEGRRPRSQRRRHRGLHLHLRPVRKHHPSVRRMCADQVVSQSHGRRAVDVSIRRALPPGPSDRPRTCRAGRSWSPRQLERRRNAGLGGCGRRSRMARLHPALRLRRGGQHRSDRPQCRSRRLAAPVRIRRDEQPARDHRSRWLRVRLPHLDARVHRLDAPPVDDAMEFPRRTVGGGETGGRQRRAVDHLVRLRRRRQPSSKGHRSGGAGRCCADQALRAPIPRRRRSRRRDRRRRRGDTH